jgi:putative FmdB family regulatory protein
VPTYQYVCTACGQDLEAVQSFSDAALTECPACAGRLRKKFGSVGVVFKGSGFYRNDSRSGNGSSSAAAGGDKPAGEKSDKPKSDQPKSDKPKESTTSAGTSSTSDGSPSSGGSTGSTSSTSTSSAA